MVIATLCRIPVTLSTQAIGIPELDSYLTATLFPIKHSALSGRICLHSRQNLAYSIPPQLPHQQHQRKQLLNPEERVALGQDEEGVGPDYVSPSSWQRTCPLAPSFSIEHTLLLAPSVDVAEQLELSTSQRMERMDDSKSPRIVPMSCS